jgi:hypothetical protein
LATLSIKFLPSTATDINIPTKFSHANMLIFYQNTIRRIEPNGSVDWDDIVDKTLSDYFKLKLPDYIYINTVSYCPGGVQLVSNDEFCGNWSTLLAYMVVKCKEPDIAKIHKQLTRRGKDYLNNLMNHWDCFMVKYVEENKLYEDQVNEKIRHLNILIRDYPLAETEERKLLIKDTLRRIKYLIEIMNPRFVTVELRDLLSRAENLILI